MGEYLFFSGRFFRILFCRVDDDEHKKSNGILESDESKN